jgi:enamine deaminase RidA (YjgF/YER057c/UK114 family)
MSGTAVVTARSSTSLFPTLTAGEREEMTALGMLSRAGDALMPPPAPPGGAAHAIDKHPMHAVAVLNEAYDYPKASSFTRGIRFDLGDKTLFMISGTASVDEAGLTTHAGDFRAQLWRTYRNISALLTAEGATWHDIVRTTCYLRDIERDYRDFNEVRTAFFGWLGLDPLPASTGIQARLCREDLLVEIEAIAVIPKRRTP